MGGMKTLLLLLVLLLTVSVADGALPAGEECTSGDESCRASQIGKKMARQVVVASARDPPARNRLDVNKPELRRKLVLSALEKGGATEVDRAASRPEALERAVELGVLTRAKLDFLLTAHAAWRAAPSPEDNFASTETNERDGLIPNFFPRAIPKPDVSAHWARRLGWHCTDCLTPIYDDMGAQLADDLGVTERAVELILSQDAQAAYVDLLSRRSRALGAP